MFGRVRSGCQIRTGCQDMSGYVELGKVISFSERLGQVM